MNCRGKIPQAMGKANIKDKVDATVKNKNSLSAIPLSSVS